MAKAKPVDLDLADRDVTITHPDKVMFPELGLTKLDLVNYFLAVAPGVLNAVNGRPMALKRFVKGVGEKPFYQKRAPEPRPEWMETVEFRYPSGGIAHEIVVRDEAQLAWVINLNCVDLHPHAVRANDLLHPDELRIDLDPIPGVPWEMVRDVAMVAHEVLTDHGLVGFPKTSGNRGMHIYVRVAGAPTFAHVRTAGLAVAREVEQRAPDLATSRWWKEERHGVFIDYNQNAKDRTTVAAYSVRPTPDARVSAPLDWAEVPDCQPAFYTVATMLRRFAEVGDLSAKLDESAGDLASLLELAKQQKKAGMEEPPPRTRPRDNEGDNDQPKPTGRRRSTMPLIEIARSKELGESMEALKQWKARYPHVWPYLAEADVLVDSMRGRSSTWTRIRINLHNVPEDLRPPQEPLAVDYNPWAGMHP